MDYLLCQHPVHLISRTTPSVGKLDHEQKKLFRKNAFLVRKPLFLNDHHSLSKDAACRQAGSQ